MTTGAMVALPPDPREWVDAELGRDLAGARLVVHGRRELASGDGWPLTLIRSDAVGAAGVVAARLHGFYRCGEHGAVAVAAGDVEAHAAELVSLLVAARAELGSSEVIALAQVWQLSAEGS